VQTKRSDVGHPEKKEATVGRAWSNAAREIKQTCPPRKQGEESFAEQARPSIPVEV